MRILKISTLLLGISLALGLGTSCRKNNYVAQDSKTAINGHIEKYWHLYKVLEDGDDATNFYITPGSNKYIGFYTDGTYEEKVISGQFTVTNAGKWEYSSDRKGMKISGLSGNSSYNLVIQSLTATHLQFSVTSGNTVTEYFCELQG